MTSTGSRSPTGPSADRHSFLHRAIRLSQFSIAWSTLSGLSAVVVGTLAGALSLAGYGLDASADAAASVVLLHRFHTERLAPHRADSLERRAARLVALALILISIYLAVSGIHALATHHAPESTTLGVAIAAASIVILSPLSVAKRRVAATLGSPAMRADSVLTAVAAGLAVGALLGLILDPAFGWWWADSVIALAAVAVLIREAASILTE